MIKLKKIVEISDFQNYGDSEGRFREISKEAIIKTIKDNQIDLAEIYKNGAMWRGNPMAENNFYMIEPQNYTRVSAYTENYYTLLIDNSPSWAAYPKRSKSLICSTDKALGEAFGRGDEPFLIVPLDKNAKVGICSADDISVSFKMFSEEGTETDITDFNFFILNMSQHFDLAVETYNDLLRIFETLDKNKVKLLKAFKEGSIPYFHEFELLEIWERTDKTMLEVIRKIFNPKFNDFKLIKYFDEYRIFSHYNENEVWTDSKSLMIKSSEVENVIGSLM